MTIDIYPRYLTFLLFPVAYNLQALILWTLLYVLPFYLSPTTRPSPNTPALSTSVIRGRIRSVTLTCIICSIITVRLIQLYTRATVLESFHQLAWYPISVVDTVKPIFLTIILFAGPLFERGIVEGGWRDWIVGKGVVEELSSWMGWRTYIAGPLSEEILFRSLLVSIALLSPLLPAPILLYTPLYFGIAHIHHFYEFYLTNPGVPIVPALLRSLFQFAFTTVFGWYATFVYLRTGNVWSVVITHAFCNWMGLPRVWGRVELPGPEEGIMGPDMGMRSKEDSANGRMGATAVDRRLSGWWTALYYTVLLWGAVGFYKYLWVLTESENALAKF
ncbi:MAG: hypothetical protein MMC33_006586 [Icmadophila ericetorum]|nr:hypothetical protein [Icmadophila ericetorum]